MGRNVLLVEDELSLRSSLKKLLELKRYEVEEAEDFYSAVKHMDTRPFDIFILDLKLPDKNGMNLLKEFPREMDGRTIIITAHATIPSAVEAIKHGAFYYLEKPLDEELLFIQMKKICEYSKLRENNITLKKELLFDHPSDTIIYQSPIMAQIISQARKLSHTDDTIIIQGETGVGKEVVARFIHRHSKRKNHAFLPINCSSIPEQLFESELFGFKRGAFTGASKDYNGRFVQANDGTLFLDEISDLPISLQSKLLRILDDKILYQLGNKNPQKIDIRLVTATNRDLWQEVQTNRFRKDLYFRLREGLIIIPPLRERREDILPLSHYFISVFNTLYDKNVKTISKGAEKLLVEYPWEGNVRELKNAIKSIFASKETTTITTNDLIFTLKITEDQISRRFQPLKDHEQTYIKHVLKANNFNIKKTSEILGISRSRLYRKIVDLDLKNGVQN